MFYSHDILTDRKHGVATVWLVATLGAKSSTKKISRKGILDVDIAKACRTISTPDVPLALRLQSSLLYGVASVYSKQCGYVLNDVESANRNMRLMLKVVDASALDAEGTNKGRSDQIALQDDPDFLPDFELHPYDLEQMNVELSAMEASQHSTLSPHESRAVGLNNTSPQNMCDLMIPNSASSFVGGLDIFGMRGDSGAGSRMGHKTSLDDALGLEIDEDGNLVMSGAPSQQYDRVPASRKSGAGEESVGRSMQSQHAHKPIGQDKMSAQPDDDGFVPLQDDYVAGLQHPTSEDTEEPRAITSEESAEAPQRRRPKVLDKPLPLDRTMELHNGDLAGWDQHYLANMEDAIRQKHVSKANAIAKQNAEHWILGDGDRGPLSMFSGIKLLKALIAEPFTTSREKRPRDVDDEEEGNARSVRSRGEPSSDELGRGDQDHDFFPASGDETVEEGREAPTPLDDRHISSMMPWNQSTGSRQPTGLFTAGGHPTSGASLAGPGTMFARRGSRLTSASPLTGRGGNAGGNVDEIPLPQSQDDISMTGYEEFELFGPAAQVDTQTAGQTQWQRAILDGESLHFLDFVRNGIEERDHGRAQASAGEVEDETLQGSVDFEKLLPPSSHSRIVASQGLLHVLALGTKGLLSVEQSEEFGPIRLRTTETV